MVSAASGSWTPAPALVPEAAAALIGSTLDDQALAVAGQACKDSASPISDKRGTAEYRKKVVAVLCRRAVAIAHQRALEN